MGAKSQKTKKAALRMMERAGKKVKASKQRARKYAQKKERLTKQTQKRERARKYRQRIRASKEQAVKTKLAHAQKSNRLRGRKERAHKDNHNKYKLRGRKERAHKDNHNKYRKNKSRKQALTSKSMSLNAKKRLIKTLPKSQRAAGAKAVMKSMSSGSKVKALAG